MRRLLCMIVAMIVALTLVVQPFVVTASTTKISQKRYLVFENEDTKIELYMDENGNSVVLEYINGVFTQRNTVDAENACVIREKINTNIKGSDVDKIYIDDYLEVKKVNMQPDNTSRALTHHGTIIYKTPDTSNPDSFRYYGIACKYSTYVYEDTICTINKYQGTLVDLVALLVGALELPAYIASSYLGTLLVALGISVVAGIIKNAITDTVSCRETAYTWTLVDVNNTSHTGYAYGSKYYITDEKSSLQGQTYYDGYTLASWQTQGLAVAFHNIMFGYTVWEVHGWVTV